MLSIRSLTTGVDLVANPPDAIALKATSDAGVGYTLAIEAVEDDQTLPLTQVQITVDWNDGTANSVFPYGATSSGTNTVNVLHTLSLGDHVIRVEAQNLRAPAADFKAVNFDVTVLPRIQFGTPVNILFGPILPKDDGFPNAQQWNFNSGVDSEILASSVKMLFSTTKGERIMLPDYGTNLRLLLFSQTSDGLQEQVQREIQEALVKWEPRVALESLNITVNTDKSMTVDLTVSSKLTQQQFTVTNTFSP